MILPITYYKGDSKNMKKKTGKMAAEKVKMNQRMTERIQWIDKQTCWYLMQLLNLDMDEAKKRISAGC